MPTAFFGHGAENTPFSSRRNGYLERTWSSQATHSLVCAYTYRCMQQLPDELSVSTKAGLFLLLTFPNWAGSKAAVKNNNMAVHLRIVWFSIFMPMSGKCLKHSEVPGRPTSPPFFFPHLLAFFLDKYHFGPSWETLQDHKCWKKRSLLYRSKYLGSCKYS